MNKLKAAFFAVMLFTLVGSTFALGISPSRKVVSFTSDLQQELSFSILNGDNKDIDVIIYPRGELADYVLIEKSSMHLLASQKEVKVRYKINVPYSIRKPGTNTLEIVVEEVPSDYEKQTVISGKIAVVHQLLLNSPYNGKYLRTMLTTNNPEEGQNLELSFALFNEGTEKLDVLRGDVSVLNSNFESVAQSTYDFNPLDIGESRKDVKTMYLNLPPGDYYVKSNLKYEGRIINLDATFTVGGSYIEIGGISSSNFKLGEINQLDVSVYNKVSVEIKNVFGEIIVQDKNDKVYNIIKTISIDLLPNSGNNLFGYWDTSSLAIGVYDLLVKVKYSGREAQKEFEVKVLNDQIIASQVGISGRAVTQQTKSKDPIINILILSFVVLMILNVLLILYIRKGKNPPQIPPSTMNVILIANLVLLGIVKNL
ncbi:MAG: hypothetical protein AABW88_03390 [Nanoarchaeota archaeon]